MINEIARHNFIQVITLGYSVVVDGPNDFDLVVPLFQINCSNDPRARSSAIISTYTNKKKVMLYQY
jgi:hypothetical protein